MPRTIAIVHTILPNRFPNCPLENPKFCRGSWPQRRPMLATDVEVEVKSAFWQRVRHGAHRATKGGNTGVFSTRMCRLMLIDTALNVTVSGTFRQESSKEENLESPQLSNNTRHVKLRPVGFDPTTNGLKVYAQHKTSNRRKALTFNDLRRKRRQAKALRICKTTPYRARLSVFRRHRQGHLDGKWDRFRHLNPGGYPGGAAGKIESVDLFVPICYHACVL